MGKEDAYKDSPDLTQEEEARFLEKTDESVTSTHTDNIIADLEAIDLEEEARNQDRIEGERSGEILPETQNDITSERPTE